VWVEPKLELTRMGRPLHGLRQGRRIVQGFFVDPAWYFDALPQTVALSVLSQRARFLREGETCCEGDTETHQARVRPIADLGFESENAQDAGYQTYRIAIDTTQIDARYRERLWRFLGVASMLALALSTGVFLLGRSVQKDLEQAQRTENFIAAVTHELRTPLSAIKLHGEMLLDGWAKEAAQQQEYYRRIVRETERLSTLVERVLEKAKLSSGAATPVEGDLSEEVSRHVDKLVGWRAEGPSDLSFELSDDLPPVMLTSEAVASILVNLVENARKYAPVDVAGARPEPIQVVTRRHGAGAALEVADRGPGVPEAERRRVFEAFYRVGNESTRTTRGTGLGLHLVALHAASLGGKAEVESRPGGGALFRVVFRPAGPA
jgi:signal transduction histidine kinase